MPNRALSLFSPESSISEKYVNGTFFEMFFFLIRARLTSSSLDCCCRGSRVAKNIHFRSFYSLTSFRWYFFSPSSSSFVFISRLCLSMWIRCGSSFFRLLVASIFERFAQVTCFCIIVLLAYNWLESSIYRIIIVLCSYNKKKLLFSFALSSVSRAAVARKFQATRDLNANTERNKKKLRHINWVIFSG